MEPSKATSVNSRAEELFVQLFCGAFGPEKTENLQAQYPCVDIYGRHRYIDFALESPESKLAIGTPSTNQQIHTDRPPLNCRD